MRDISLRCRPHQVQNKRRFNTIILHQSNLLSKQQLEKATNATHCNLKAARLLGSGGNQLNGDIFRVKIIC